MATIIIKQCDRCDAKHEQAKEVAGTDKLFTVSMIVKDDPDFKQPLISGAEICHKCMMEIRDFFAKRPDWFQGPARD